MREDVDPNEAVGSKPMEKNIDNRIEKYNNLIYRLKLILLIQQSFNFNNRNQVINIVVIIRVD